MLATTHSFFTTRPVCMLQANGLLFAAVEILQVGNMDKQHLQLGAWVLLKYGLTITCYL